MRILNHPSQPRRKKKSNRSQYADQNEHPEEYPVNDHSHILPVLLHLGQETQQKWDISKFLSHHTSCQFSPMIDFSPMVDFPITKQQRLKMSLVFFFFVSLIKKINIKLQRSRCFFFVCLFFSGGRGLSRLDIEDICSCSKNGSWL